MRKVVTIFTSVLLVVMYSCNDSSVDPSLENRQTYYTVSASDSDNADIIGLYSVVSGGSPQLIIPGSALHVTGVGAGGVVLTELQNLVSGSVTIKARCSDGNTIDVPFPVHPDVQRTYSLMLPPYVALAYDAHYAAYLAVNSPIAPTRDRSQYRLTLVRVCCSDKSVQTIDLHDSVVSSMKSVSAAAARPCGSNILLDRDGGTAWIAVTGVNFPADFEAAVGYEVMQWTASGLKVVLPLSSTPYILSAYDQVNQAVLYEYGGTVYSLRSGAAKGVATAFKSGSIQTPVQVAVTRAVAAVFGQNGIEIRNTYDGSLLSQPIAYDDLMFHNAYNTGSSDKSISISPDGEWIVFTLPRLTGGDKTLFAIRSNGMGFTTLVPHLKCGVPVMSK